ncbi:MAG: hypothetical protein ACKO5F_10820 [Synechococcus sp.]
MASLWRPWLRPLCACLLLQALLAGSGELLHRWLAPEVRCCVSPLEL